MSPSAIVHKASTGSLPHAIVSPTAAFDHAAEAAIAIGKRLAAERREIKAFCEARDYGVNLLQVVRKHVGLKPDPQLAKEWVGNERKAN